MNQDDTYLKPKENQYVNAQLNDANQQKHSQNEERVYEAIETQKGMEQNDKLLYA